MDLTWQASMKTYWGTGKKTLKRHQKDNLALKDSEHTLLGKIKGVLRLEGGLRDEK